MKHLIWFMGFTIIFAVFLSTAKTPAWVAFDTIIYIILLIATLIIYLRIEE